jgi:hypothetical protein
MDKKQRQKSETAEMKLLRNVARYTLKDQIRNTVIIKRTKYINNRIQNNRLNLIHVERI